MAPCSTHWGLRKDRDKAKRDRPQEDCDSIPFIKTQWTVYKAKRDRPQEDCDSIPFIKTQWTVYIGKEYAMTSLEFRLYSISKSGFFLTHSKNVSQL